MCFDNFCPQCFSALQINLCHLINSLVLVETLIRGAEIANATDVGRRRLLATEVEVEAEAETDRGRVRVEVVAIAIDDSRARVHRRVDDAIERGREAGHEEEFDRARVRIRVRETEQEEHDDSTLVSGAQAAGEIEIAIVVLIAVVVTTSRVVVTTSRVAFRCSYTRTVRIALVRLLPRGTFPALRTTLTDECLRMAVVDLHRRSLVAVVDLRRRSLVAVVADVAAVDIAVADVAVDAVVDTAGMLLCFLLFP